jgi:hypothetical protein
MASYLRLTSFLLLISTIARPTFGWCGEYLVQRLPARQIEQGCDLTLYAVEDESVEIGRPNHTLDLRWACKEGEAKTIDTYQIEGGSPKVATILYRKNR